ncbi:unnamed protein product [Trichobilharzia szidati]|nr:unnamed protein product [Trichobilharzia szidati]
MSCPTCENRNLVEDENTGQLICAECGTATGVFRGVTQSQDFCETRGLRVIQKQLNPVNADNSETLDVKIIETNSTVNQTANSVPRNRNCDTLDDLFTSDDVDIINISQKDKSKEKSRPWRLSEPFTFIMKSQANSLAKELNLSDEEKTTLCDAVWNIWLHYLAITGELGSDAWLDAAVALTKSISEVYQSKIGSLKEGDRPRHRNLRRCKENVRYCNSTPLLYENEWEFIRTRLSQLQWFGWGMLYEPDEGREIVSMLHVSQRKSKKLARENAKLTRQRKRKRKSDSDSSSDETDYFSDEDNVEDRSFTPRRKSRSRKGLEDSNEKNVSSPVKTTDSGVFPIISYEKYTRDVLAPYFTKKLCRLPDMSNLFWRGQMEGGITCRGLLEHNISVLFFACLTTSPIRKAFNPLFSSSFMNPGFPNVPYALSTMITLKDLLDLCVSRRLPFIAAEQLFPPGAFCIRDQCLRNMIRRLRHPEIEVLTYATVRMRDFLGLNHFPKYPLIWLVHRHIVALGLPEIMHVFVKPLLERLHKQCVAINELVQRPLLHFIQWPRVVRPEVFAMAFVVILLRLVFKFNDTFEYQLSSVARALESFPDRPVESAQTGSVSLYDRPFVWLAWMQYIDSRFYPSHKINTTLSKSERMSYSNEKVRDTNQPLIMTARRGNELLNIEKASDLLGLAEFKIGQDVGWGEIGVKKIKVANASVKMSLSQPLRNLYGNDTTTNSNSTTDNHRQKQEHHQKIDDSFIFTSSAKSTQCISPKPILLSSYEQDGLLSPFRKTQLNYLYDENININEYFPISSNNYNTFSQSYTFNNHTIREWWLDLIDVRSDYFPICTGEWSFNYSNKHLWQNRNRMSFVLPKPVEDFIAKHDENLSKALDHRGVVSHSEDDRNPSTDLRVDSVVEIEDSDTEKPLCLHCCNPSQSIKWLVKVCAMVCGASNTKSLITEIECLERLFKWNAPQICSATLSGNELRHADYALLSFFDLNIDAPMLSEIVNHDRVGNT